MTTPFREATGVTFGDGDVSPQARDFLGHRGPDGLRGPGRLLIVKPVKFEANRETPWDDEKNPGQKKRQDVVFADVLVLDASHLGLAGGPMEFGGDGKTKPNTDRINTPALFKSVLFGQKFIVSYLKSEMDDKDYSGFTLGIIYESDKGTQGNPPIVLGPVRTNQWNQPRPNGDAIWAFAGEQFAAWASGQLVPHTESELIQPSPNSSPDVWKAYQERLAKRHAKTGQSAPIAVQPTSYAPPSTPAAQPTQYAPGPPAQAAPVNPIDQVPPNYDPAAWGNLNGSVRAMIWQSLGGAPAVQPTH